MAVKTKVIISEKIETAIESAQRGLNSITSGCLTNTYKRMREEEERERKRQAFRIDIGILEYLKEKETAEGLSGLEINLVSKAFREVIQVYYSRKFKRNDTIDYPYNYESYKKPLQKAGINSVEELSKAVDAYKEIILSVEKPEDLKGIQIRKQENKFKLQQSGDVFFTPSNVAEKMVELARIDSDSIVLEPSAGIGNIADLIQKVTKNVDCIEICYSFCELLELKGFNVTQGDFLQFEKFEHYDAIIMNPPFSNNQDIVHFKHAYNCLKEGGRLVCITSPHWTFANDRKSQEFREWIEGENHYIYDLPSGTFEMTGVNSKLIVVQK